MSDSSGKLMWKLDLLEVKFHNASPRYRNTKKLLKARHNEKLLKKLPSSSEADAQILQLKHEIFGKKYHACVKKLHRETKKLLKPNSGSSDVLEPEILDKLVVSRIIKAITNAMLPTKQLKENPPHYIPEEIRSIIIDKSNTSNPSGFFNTYCKNDNNRNKIISNLFNKKSIKTLVSEMEWTFRVVRGNITKQEKLLHKKISKAENDVSDESDESDVDDNRIAYSSDSDSDAEEPALQSRASDNDSEQQPDPEAESESGPESDSETERKYNLPQLATGYFSGGSDEEASDIDNDQVVKSVTEQRKNRRGQRARQKIWAKKYGKEAKHIKEERTRLASERERKQLEYEERERKRQMKRQAEPTGSNNQPLGDRSEKTGVVEEMLHPSWQAKKMAEKTITAKFSGKKIKFE